jgi:O-antigen/teichoic acid export membrane protein
VARRGLVIAAVWLAFLADLMVGAGFLLSKDPALNAVGLAMILVAAGALAALTLWFYVQNRRKAGPDGPS